MSIRLRQRLLVGLSILLGTSSCQLTMTELHALNPSAATLEVPCRPGQFPESVNVWAVQSGTGHIVTDEQQDELRNVAPLASVFIEVNPAAPIENAAMMASTYGLFCPNVVNLDAPSSASWYVRPSSERAPPNSQFLAIPTAPSTASAATAASGAKALPRIAQSTYSMRPMGGHRRLDKGRSVPFRTSSPQPPSPTPHHDVMLRGEGGARESFYSRGKRALRFVRLPLST